MARYIDISIINIYINMNIQGYRDEIPETRDMVRYRYKPDTDTGEIHTDTGGRNSKITLHSRGGLKTY